MQIESALPTPLTQDVLPTSTVSLHPSNDPWGIIVIGSSAATGALRGEAGRLGFELLLTESITAAEHDRLRATDWGAVLVVDNGEDGRHAVAELHDRLPTSVPLVWVGAAPPDVPGRRSVHLAADSEPEQIAATVFGELRRHLYPADLVGAIRRCLRWVVLDWGESGVEAGPVWVKNHFTPPFSMTATLDLFGDISGELVLSAREEWFQSKVDALTTDLDQSNRPAATSVATAMSQGLLNQLKAYFESRGADLSMGAPVVIERDHPAVRRLSHRPALCMEFATRHGELIAVEFSGTGLEALDTPQS